MDRLIAIQIASAAARIARSTTINVSRMSLQQVRGYFTVLKQFEFEDGKITFAEANLGKCGEVTYLKLSGHQGGGPDVTFLWTRGAWMPLN